MPTLDLFDASTEQEILAGLHSLNETVMGEDFARAERYARGQMLDDVRTELLHRYPDTQRGARPQEGVQPQAIPITQKFLEEAATLYTRPVTREVVDDNGQVIDDVTEGLRRLLGDTYNERMHQIERRVVLMQSVAGWFQARGGKLRLVSHSPHRVAPIAPADTTWLDPAAQDDYQAFAVELAAPGERSDEPGEYAYAERAQTVFYRGLSAQKPGGELETHPNPYAWPQTVDTNDGRGASQVLPLQMVTAWHDRAPDGAILPDTDIPVVDLNREVNVQWSMLLDTISHQGWSQLVANVADPTAPPSVVQVGPRNVLVLGPGETMTALDAATNYTGIVDVLTAFVKMLAQSKNLSPNDFELTGATAPASGFAKLLDMLPKVQSRQRLGERFTRMEAELAWPRIAVIGRHLGVFSQSVEQLAGMRLRTSFADVDVPRNVDEETKRLDFDLKHGLTTPARILAGREGITVDEAQERIDENRAAAAPPASDNAQQQGGNGTGARAGRAAGLLGSLIGQRSTRGN